MAINKVMSWLWAFLAGNLLIGILFTQPLQNVESPVFYFDEPSAVPLILLSAGTWVHLVTLFFATQLLNARPGAERAFPTLWDSSADTPELTLLWERISALLIIGFPVLAFGYFWIRFLGRGRAWVKDVDLVNGLVVNGGVKTCHCGGAKVGQFGVCALERVALI